MRQPLRNKTPGRGPGVVPDSVPPPVLGWNATDSLAAMDPSFAVVLDNWFPDQTDVRSRLGATTWATGLPDRVVSLLAFRSGTASELFASCETGIYDTTSAGAVGAPVYTNIASGFYNYVNYTTAAGVHYLVAVDGRVNGFSSYEETLAYDGTTWTVLNGTSTPQLDGVAGTDLCGVEVFKTRLWFLERNTLNAWYLPTGAFGVATVFPLGQIFRRGGYLTDVATWTVDGGAGVDDLLVFTTSEGEAAVYKGTDPSSAATFALVGVYYIGRPVGGNYASRVLIKYGGDLLYASAEGIGELSRLLQSASVERLNYFTRNIEKYYKQAVSRSNSIAGWQLMEYPEASFVLLNAPLLPDFPPGTPEAETLEGPYQQLVMNTASGAWCRFMGWNGVVFETFDRKLFLGQGSTVAQVWDGPNDFGASITCYAKTAFNYFGARGQQKQWTLYRPQFQLDGAGPLTLSMGLSVDFVDTVVNSTSGGGTLASDVWDVALWDVGMWSAESINKAWRSVFGPPGYCLALRLQSSSNSLVVSWLSTDYLYKPCTLGAL